MKIDLKTVSIFSAMTLLGACSSQNKDWPNLSDPIPQAEERERVDTSAVTPATKPPAPTRPVMSGEAASLPAYDPAPASEAEAESLFEDIKKTLREETLAYRQAVAKLGTAAGEDLQDAWFSAQLALTRLSRTASRLDPLLEMELPALHEDLVSEAEIIERFVVGERQRLTESEPE